MSHSDWQPDYPRYAIVETVPGIVPCGGCQQPVEATGLPVVAVEGDLPLCVPCARLLAPRLHALLGLSLAATFQHSASRSEQWASIQGHACTLRADLAAQYPALAESCPAPFATGLAAGGLN